MNVTGLLGILAGIAVAACFLLASYILRRGRENSIKDLLLSALLVAIALRIGKSIWFFILYGAAPFGVSIGFLGLASIGPLALLYTRSFAPQGMQNVSIRDAPHFIIPLGGMICIWLILPQYATLLYLLATSLLFIYLLICWQHYRKQEESDLSWLKTVLLSISLIWSTFVFQHITGTLFQYAIGAGLAAIPIYFLLVRALQENGRLHFLGNDPVLANSILEKVREAIEENSLYRTRSLTLSQFAASIEVPSYQVSKAVQTLYQRSFPETVNYFRIKEVQEHLLDPKNGQVKVEALAYEAGFSSPSSFYAAFKKETKSSPKQFQRQHARKA